jgi:hypothetical protein
MWAATGSATSNPANPTFAALDRFWSDIGSASLYVKWKNQNSGEFVRLRDYAAGGSRPVMLTAFGSSLVDIVDVGRTVGAPNPKIP